MNQTTIAIAETVIPVTLGDRDYVMRFNANTFVAYESVTGKFFMDTVSGMYDMLFPKGHEAEDGSPAPVNMSGTDLIRRISMEQLRALLWASLHEYDAKDDPVWPLTLNQIGRQLNFQNIIPIFVRFLTGVSGNAPTKAEMGESSAAAKKKKSAPSPPPITRVDGGAAGIELPAGALD
jgi:hypothetical protein